ncbi:gp162 [Bacillus phage W.Ph.]|uniref:Gp162 n=1 Tax=Bacillus phage W.Ph. TaxID=764595 RepID=G9B1R3_9CAUD|nr:gp162 [Bacillus phage W.Ph.]ADH03308.1 gp162 [Bacillus phage W.Ph.]
MSEIIFKKEIPQVQGMSYVGVTRKPFDFYTGIKYNGYMIKEKKHVDKIIELSVKGYHADYILYAFSLFCEEEVYGGGDLG